MRKGHGIVQAPCSGLHGPGFDPEEAREVVGEVGAPDLCTGSGQSDVAHEQAEAVFLAGKHRRVARLYEVARAQN